MTRHSKQATVLAATVAIAIALINASNNSSSQRSMLRLQDQGWQQKHGSTVAVGVAVPAQPLLPPVLLLQQQLLMLLRMM
jgi:hypothetical protein